MNLKIPLQSFQDIAETILNDVVTNCNEKQILNKIHSNANKCPK